MLYNHSLAFSQTSQPTDHYLTSVMCLLMHLFFTARDTTSHALGTIASAMGPCGVLGALGTSIAAYLLLQLVMGLRATVLRDILLVRLPSPWMHSASPPVAAIRNWTQTRGQNRPK